MNPKSASILIERQRIEAEYLRREREIDADRYAPWQPAEVFARSQRKRLAAAMLKRFGVFPKPGDQCLELGYGKLGWLADLIDWGVHERDLHGIELRAPRGEQARDALPLADLRIGDASSLPWKDETFQFAITSTVFSSILDDTVREKIAAEISRVLVPGGALLWYDLAVNNPGNRQVRGIGRAELRRLFPQLDGPMRSVTLAPPISRLVTPRSWALATLLETIPVLRTHVLAVLIKVR